MRSGGGLGQAWTWSWCAVVLAFPWSNALMSVATGGLAAVALWTRFRVSAPADRRAQWGGWPLLALVMWTAASFLWSDVPEGAWNDARVKLPLAVGALAWMVGAARPLAVQVNASRIVSCAVFSAVLATWTLVGLDVVDGGPNGGREASRFISHIRFGLWWAVLLPWALQYIRGLWASLVVASAFLAWSWTESVTGLIAGVITAAWWAPMWWASVRGKRPEWPEIRALFMRLAGVGVVLVSCLILLTSSLPMDRPDPHGLAEFTQGGEAYMHRLDRRVTENGHFIWTEVAWGELANGWGLRSNMPFDEVKSRLIRFLASKGWPKDGAAVAALDAEEIRAIEAGYASVVEWRGIGWVKRWNRIRFNWGQWLDGRRTSDASLLARSVYQQAAWSAISANLGPGFLIGGVGSGDALSTLRESYERTLPDWPERDRHRPHQQYLSLCLGLGLVGLLLWLVAMGQAVRRTWAWPSALVLALSGFSEDTLNTQAGVTLAVLCLVLPMFLQGQASTRPSRM